MMGPGGLSDQGEKFIVSVNQHLFSNDYVPGTEGGRNRLERSNFRRLITGKNGVGCTKSLWWLYFCKEDTEVRLQRTKEGM